MSSKKVRSNSLALDMEYSNFIEKVLKQSSKIANRNFGNVVGTIKPDNSVLTETDLEIGQLIISLIKKEYPDYNIIDEEAGVINNHSDFTWVIDPIDGTSNFALGIPHFGIFLGLLEKNKPIAGGIALPFFNEIILAQKGKGAFCNGIPIGLNSGKELIHTMIAYGFNHKKDKPSELFKELNTVGKILLGCRNIRTSNSAYDVVLTLKGKYGAIIGTDSKIWDNVVPQLIMEEIGYKYTDYFGNKIDYSDCLNNPQKNFSYCAASPIIFEQLQNIIKS